MGQYQTLYRPGDIDNMIGPPCLRTDALEELLQWRNQHGGLALPQEVHEHHLLLQGQVQQAQAVQHCRLQVLLACRGRVTEHGVRTSTRSRSQPLRAATYASLTREGGVGVQLADTLLQQAETKRQHGRVVEQVEHDAVSGGLVGRDLLAL